MSISWRIMPLFFLALWLSGTQSAFPFGDRVSSDKCSFAAGGDVSDNDIKVFCGIDPELFRRLQEDFRLATQVLHAKSAIQEELLGFMRSKLQLNERQVAAALEVAGEKDIPPERLASTLLQIAEQYNRMREQLAAVPEDNSDITRLKRQIKTALEEAELDRADDLYDELIEAEDTAADRQALAAASARAQKGELALSRLRYLDAADLFAKAAKRVPIDFEDERIGYLEQQAKSLYKQGDEFGDNQALADSISLYQALLKRKSRSQVPLEWARAQSDLGGALLVLGSREAGTGRLEEAVAAYRLALEESTRARVPLKWASTQSNLGSALQVLGSREVATGRLEEAVAAFRLALEELTRARVPLAWAMTQHNLGNALSVLELHDAETGHLEEAVAVLRLALEERTRARVPLAWARTQRSLGDALYVLGSREAGTARLEEAVAAFRSALEESARARVPLDWATTQSSLGVALLFLGEREAGTGRLEEAVAAFRLALEENTRARVPLRWARTQSNLGSALFFLGERGAGTERLEEAVAAYRLALEELTRDRIPLQWAGSQKNLGIALQKIGERKAHVSLLLEAKAKFELLDNEYKAVYGDRSAGYFAKKIDEIDRLVSDLNGGGEAQ